MEWRFIADNRLELLSMQLISLMLLCLVANGAFAQGGGDPDALYAGADVVFTGRAERIEASPTGLTARFKIDQLIKGRVITRNGLRASLPTESSCHAFKQQHSYLVYGRWMGGELWVDPCEGSKPISLAEHDLRYIHTINPKASERCNEKRLAQLAAKSPIVATAEIIGTEDLLDSLRSSATFFRPWCGLVHSTEDAYYTVRDVLKGQIPDSKIAVQHAICWDTITVDGDTPQLSPELFKEGKVLLLFLKAGSHQPNREGPPPFKSVYEDVDEDCGAVMADTEAARSVVVNGRFPSEPHR